jgi:hypothetical protein
MEEASDVRFEVSFRIKWLACHLYFSTRNLLPADTSAWNLS